MMTADGRIRNGAVSEVDCKVRHNTVHLAETTLIIGCRRKSQGMVRSLRL